MKFVPLLIAAIVVVQLQGAGAIGAVHATPMTAVVGTATHISIEASVTDASLIPGSVNLLQLSSNGVTSILATLHDDGQNGDRYVADGIFTAVLVLNAAVPSQVQLQVSAAFRGQLQRSRSTIVNVYFQPPDAPQQSLAALGTALASGDVATALNYVVPSNKNTTALNTLGRLGLTALASMLNTATPLSAQNDLRIFQTYVGTPSGNAVIQFTMIPGPDGRWVVNTW